MNEENLKFCQECGEKINIKAEICPKCGVRQVNIQTQSITEDKWLITLLLCLFLGYLGIHRFYTGHTLIGVLQILTLGGCGVWVLIDFIIIITGGYKDANGNPIQSK